MLRSTEIVVEQLITGFLAIASVLLIVYGGYFSAVVSSHAAKYPIVYSVLVVLAAYAVGIIADRIADSLLQNVEKRARLGVALEGCRYADMLDELRKGKLRNDFDLMPEDKVRLQIQKLGEGVLEHHEYLRTRMRITRAIACLAPALFLGLLLSHIHADVSVRLGSGLGLLAVYGLTYLWVNTQRIDEFAPRTDKADKISTLIESERARGNPDSENKAVELKWDWWYAGRPLIFGISVASILGIAVAVEYGGASYDTPGLLLYPIAGALLAILAASAWHRISKTFFRFIKRFHRDASENKSESITDPSDHRLEVVILPGPQIFDWVSKNYKPGDQ